MEAPVCDSRTETVIIPHPTECAKLSRLQKSLCAQFLLAPELPLFVHLSDQAQEAVYNAKALCCTLSAPAYDATTGELFCPAEIDTCADTQAEADGTQIFTGTLTLARVLSGVSAAERLDNTPILEVAAESTASFPLTLPVCRIATVHFAESANGVYWEIEKARWVKRA